MPAPPPVESPPPRPPVIVVPGPLPANAIEAGVHPGPADLPFDDAALAAIYRTFRTSCNSLRTRRDASGLTQPDDWRAVCDPIIFHGGPDAYGRLLRRELVLVRIGDGAAFSTGYYEPEIRGSRTRRPGYDIPVYAPPPDLLNADPRSGERRRGRVDESGNYVPYHDRTGIEEGVLAGRGLEIAWAADAADLFFLQIQGSGRLRLPDGGVMRIGYAGQNGHEYVAIGRLLRDRGILQPPVTMQAIRAWMAANPEAGRALMRENPSYVFFRELTDPGPLGSLGVPVTPRVSIAADPHFVPLGALVMLADMDNPRANGLWVAQDTGGAIRGANRFDTFWGAGEESAAIAGGMQARGRAHVLIPRAAFERLRNRAAPPER